MRKLATILGAAALSVPATAHAAGAGQASATKGLKITPLLDARLRYENVDQGTSEADALTLRVRGGAEAKIGTLSILAEAEGTVAPVDNYNAFPFPIVDHQRRPQYAVVADPRNVELNRLQMQYKSSSVTGTAGRQRINLDDQRWVGSVGWRQNEQTFDALRGEARLGPLAFDVTYAISQRTIFGEDADSRTALGGDFIFAGVGLQRGVLEGKLFSYLLDYDEDFAHTNSSQTYGGIMNATVPIGGGTKLSLRGSYARQSDYATNPFRYAATYWSFEGRLATRGFTALGGWEKLGSDDGHSVQTPMATLHKFNGWADLFLTTPSFGLEDAYVALAKSFDGVKLLRSLNANVVFHQFDSAASDVEYGTEWDASAGFKLGKIGFLMKYADYNAKGFGLDTRKLWLQAEWAF
jgi:hypothetical protein